MLLARLPLVAAVGQPSLAAALNFPRTFAAAGGQAGGPSSARLLGRLQTAYPLSPLISDISPPLHTSPRISDISPHLPYLHTSPRISGRLGALLSGQLAAMKAEYAERVRELGEMYPRYSRDRDYSRDRVRELGE